MNIADHINTYNVKTTKLLNTFFFKLLSLMMKYKHDKDSGTLFEKRPVNPLNKANKKRSRESNENEGP